MIQKPFADDQRYIHCPTCGLGQSSVSHLPAGTKTRWYCHRRECGAEFDLHVISPEEIDCTPTGGREVPTVVTLAVKGPFVVTVDGYRFEPDKAIDDEERASNLRYHYEDKMCPSDTLQRVIEVYDMAGNEDPHSLFTLIKVEDANDNLRDDKDQGRIALDSGSTSIILTDL